MAVMSIIVPIYNVENFLESSIRTLLNQTLQDIEIILVNDGSTDKSLEICYKLQLEDSRIKVYSQKNQGVSSARNLGIQQAHGDYIGFFDADDFAMPDMYKVLLDNLLENNVDMSCVNYIRTKKNFLEILNDKSNVNILNQDEAIKDLLINCSIGNEVWSKLFRHDIITSYNLKFPLEYAIAEDKYFVFNYLLHCNNISYNTARKYNYVYRKNSVMCSSYSKKNLSSLYVSRKIIDIISIDKPHLEKFAEMGYYFEKVFNLKLIIKNNNNNNKLYYNYILNDLLKNDYTKEKFWMYQPARKKFEYFLIKHFYSIYKILIKIKT